MKMRKIALFACVAFSIAMPVDPSKVPIARAELQKTIRRELVPLDSIVPGTLLVHRRDGEVPRPIAGARFVGHLADGTERWELEGDASASSTRAARDALANDPSFEGEVELDLYRQAQLVPDDDGYKNQWPLPLLKAPDAWNVTTGDENLTVAVVDTGVVEHPDLKPRLVAGYDFITDPNNGGDGDGRDPSPIDTGDESESSSGFHGTHIAGIIGAASGNGTGMAGVDWRCKIQAVRVLGVNRHRGKDSDIADGIRWASGLNVPGVPQNKTPARIINLSFGGPGFSRVLQDAVLAALARGSLVIASAGNNHEDATTNVPASLEGVMAVAAAGPSGAPATYSNFGPRVDLMTPGGSLFLDAPIGDETPGAIWSTSYLRSTSQPVFAFAAGTSQAAAYASGVAALVRAAAPSLRPEVVAAVMRRASREPKEGCPDGCGAGLVDASLAVTYAKQISEATCGSLGCGSNVLEPAKLRPEEGCSLSRAPGSRSTSSYASIVFVGLISMARRRRAKTRRGCRKRFVLALVAAIALGCAYGESGRDAQSTRPLTVRIKNPIPTFRDGDLQLSVGEGKTLEVEVDPVDDLEMVELTARSPDVTLARVAHAPFLLFLPKWAPGPDGQRLVCVTATNASDEIGETCFLAVK